jgi:hypothetical protein
MTVLMRPVKPDLARQAGAALLMDTTDMTFDATSIRTSYPDLPATMLADLMAPRGTLGA